MAPVPDADQRVGMELDGAGLAEAVARRTAEIVEALALLDDTTLLAPCELPGWSRLTVACHVRYGAEALARMTAATVAGEPVAYYPGGRAVQRPGTLHPAPGEDAAAVVASLGHHGTALDRVWSALRQSQWKLEVVEPPDNPDLGVLALDRFALLRLTEVEVHGTDLDLGLADWSDGFVAAALPFRLGRLRATDPTATGSWSLVARDGPSHRVTLHASGVTVEPADVTSGGDAVIEASTRDLVALLLGRPWHQPPTRATQPAVDAFTRTFPGP